MAATLHKLGEVTARSHDWHKAKQYFEESLRMQRALADLREICDEVQGDEEPITREHVGLYKDLYKKIAPAILDLHDRLDGMEKGFPWVVREAGLTS